MYITPLFIIGISGMAALISVLGIIGYLGTQKIEIDYGAIGKNFLKHLKTYKEATISNEGKVGKFYYAFFMSLFVFIVSIMYLIWFFATSLSQ